MYTISSASNVRDSTALKCTNKEEFVISFQSNFFSSTFVKVCKVYCVSDVEMQRNENRSIVDDFF